MQKDGVVRVTAVVANDGRLVCVASWPDGYERVFDRDEMVAFCITGLKSAASLFPTAEEFAHNVNIARQNILNLHPGGGIQ